MSGADELHVLAYTTLFPSPSRPMHGLFVKRRLEHLARRCDVRVVAPVSLTADPGTALRGPRRRRLDGLDVRHPAFAVLPGLLKHRDGDLLYRQSRRSAARAFRERRVDVVDAHYAFPDGYAAGRIASEWGCPYVVSLRGSDVHVLTRFPERRVRIVASLRGAAAVVAVSEDLARAARELGVDPKRIRVIPNGVETDRFHVVDRHAARRRLGIPAEGKLVLSVGRLVPVKGFDLLLGAFRRLRENGNREVRCVIAGDGPQLGELRRGAADLVAEGAVDFPGWIDPARLPDWYAAADVFALLSESEGCPNVVVEALACGTPVVATAVGGLPEMIRDGENGLLVRSRSAEASAERMGEALRSKWEPAAIRGSGSVRTWDEVASRQLETLREAAGR